MENLIRIVTQPDNIAIVVMLVAIAVCTAVAFREIWINDRLIQSGKKDEIYKRMTK